ncbi:hypothetical protein HYX16_06800 [Candidatus Woesearchaeota archaeon]|nr:hypothetical protein [Candidatus Woesearchaeota archaeon]
MPHFKLNLPGNLSWKIIEEACIKTSEELAYKVKSEDQYDIEYDLNPVTKREIYKCTLITIGRGNPNSEDFKPFLHIWAEKDTEQNEINVSIYEEPTEKLTAKDIEMNLEMFLLEFSKCL